MADTVSRREALARIGSFFAVAALPLPLPHSILQGPASLPDGSMILVRDYMRRGEIDALPAWGRVLAVAARTKGATVMAVGLPFSDAPVLPVERHWPAVWSDCLIISSTSVMLSGMFSVTRCHVYMTSDAPAIRFPAGIHYSYMNDCYFEPLRPEDRPAIAQAARQLALGVEPHRLLAS